MFMTRCARRGKRASTFLLSTLCGAIISGIGVFFILLTVLLGGFRELQNAVDSGTLNVAKNMSQKPEVALLATEVPTIDERSEFVECSDPQNPGMINLSTINKVMLHALVTATNARTLNTPVATAHARDVIQASKLISNRLKNALLQNGGANNISPASKTFLAAAQGYPLSMVGTKANSTLSVSQYACTYLKQDGTGVSNACVDGLDFPDKDKLTRKLSDGHTYMLGYVDVPVLDTYIQFVPVQTNQKPHLISNTIFWQNAQSPPTAAQLSDGNPVPPNGVLMAGRAFSERQAASIVTSSAATLGVSKVVTSRPYYMRIAMDGHPGVPWTPAGLYEWVAFDPKCEQRFLASLLPSFKLLNPSADEEFIKNFFLSNHTILYLRQYWYIVKDPQTSNIILLESLPPSFGNPATADGEVDYIRDRSPIFVPPKYFYVLLTPGSGYTGNVCDIFFQFSVGNNPDPSQ